MKDVEEIGKRIKQIRTARGLTQTEFGELFGADQPVVSRMENKGDGLYDLSKIQAVAAALEVHYLYLLEGDGIRDYLEKKGHSVPTKIIWKKV